CDRNKRSPVDSAYEAPGLGSKSGAAPPPGRGYGSSQTRSATLPDTPPPGIRSQASDGRLLPTRSLHMYPDHHGQASCSQSVRTEPEQGTIFHFVSIQFERRCTVQTRKGKPQITQMDADVEMGGFAMNCVSVQDLPARS